MGTDNLTGPRESSRTRSENAVGKLKRESGWGKGNSERDCGNLGNSKLDEETKAGCDGAVGSSIGVP